MKNGHIAVYDLWFFFIVSIDELILLHFYKWEMDMQMENLIYLYPKGCVFPSSPTILILISGYIAILW